MSQRSITSVQIICDYASGLGLAPQDLIANSAIRSEQLQQDCQIDEQQELQVINNLLSHTGSPYETGMELGMRYQLTSYGIFGYALLSSSTLRQAITFGQQYLALTYIFSELLLIEEAETQQALIEIRCPLAGDTGKLLASRDMWAVLVIMRELLPELEQGKHNIVVELDMPEPDGFAGSLQAKLLQQAGVNWHFNAGRFAFAGLSTLLDEPLPKANAMTAQLCEQQCRELLNQKQTVQSSVEQLPSADQSSSVKQSVSSRPPSVCEQVRNQILTLGLTSSMEQVASSMARTSRTLHRQLHNEGSSWRQVRDDVRLGLAEAFLKQALSIEVTAERLGYSNSANFSHAFKRWKGVTPSVYRKDSLNE